MRPSFVVILDILGQHSSQVTLVDNEQVVKAFFSNGSNPPFRECVRFGCSTGSEYRFYAFSLEYPVEGSSELGIAVVDQKSYRQLAISQILKIPSEVS
jgi:hypothetical protein